MKRIDVQKELKKILTSNMTTGEILRALTELRIRRAKEKKLAQKPKM